MQIEIKRKIQGYIVHAYTYIHIYMYMRVCVCGRRSQELLVWVLRLPSCLDVPVKWQESLTRAGLACWPDLTSSNVPKPANLLAPRLK